MVTNFFVSKFYNYYILEQYVPEAQQHKTLRFMFLFTLNC